MADKTTEYKEKLKQQLREMFQIDLANELDFGIYRIMNYRKNEIEKFIEEDLIEQVNKSLSNIAEADKEGELQKLSEIKQKVLDSLGGDAFQNETIKDEYADTPLGKEYNNQREIIEQLKVDEETEREIYNHLLTFFSRYYDNADFISKRRFGKEKYVIPYNGEEVMLHWANKDQYYIKTAKHFHRYSFTIPSGSKNLKVSFEVVEAEEEKGNKKAEKERHFWPSDREPELLKGTGKQPDELKLYIEYRELTEKEKEKIKPATKTINQDDLIKVIVSVFKNRIGKEAAYSKLFEEEDGKTSLYKNLRRYVRENKSDYFIHKDLGGFLNRELDFYIKNEVLSLNYEEGDYESYSHSFVKARVIAEIAKKIIEFLAQIENFQKMLWEKKKFVLETGYCITLDRIPDDLYPEIVANNEQRKEWVHLFSIDEIKEDNEKTGYSNPLTIEFLKHHDKLMLDTKHFSKSFTYRLLESIDDFDQQCDGVIIKSENFQALNLLQNHYKEQVKCVYIDPPYNTEKDRNTGKFIYKDSYEHSSWFSMIKDRLTLCDTFQPNDSVGMISIDENEYSHTRILLKQIHGEENILTPFIWKRKAGGGDDSTHIAMENEYVAVYSKSHANLILNRIKHESKSMTAKYNKLENGRRYYLERLDKTSLTYSESMDYGIIAPDGTEVFPPQPNKEKRTTIWRWSQGKVQAEYHQLEFIKDKNDEWRVYTKTWEPDERGVTPRNLLVDADTFGRNRDGTQELSNILGPKEFPNPKPTKYLNHLLFVSTHRKSIVLDYFAGSGTTGHAVINLNREDAGKRKYILVEMAKYFDLVLKPRIQKVVYANQWKDGNPQHLTEYIKTLKKKITDTKKVINDLSGFESQDDYEFEKQRLQRLIEKNEELITQCEKDMNSGNAYGGLSHCFKYLTLEQYEDTLDNIELSEEFDTSKLQFNDYIPKYMIFEESGKSKCLLNTDEMKNPFNYTLRISEDQKTKDVKVDLVETFNYLIGLKVNKLQRKEINGNNYVLVTGTTNVEGRDAVIVWRDVSRLNTEDKIKKDREAILSLIEEFEYDDLYINGSKTNLDRKYYIIEEVMQERMFTGVTQ